MGFGEWFEDRVRDVGSAIDDAIIQPLVKVTPLLAQINVAAQAYEQIINWINPEIPSTDLGLDTKAGIDLSNRVGLNESISLAYGRVRSGGIMYPIGVTGATNEYLHLVFVLSEGECDGLEKIYLDDVDSIDPRFAGYVDYSFFNGSDAQAASINLTAAFPTWTTNHTASGICYVWLRLKYDGNIFNGMPRVQFMFRGKKIFDTRTSTTIWSQNPAMILRDYLLSARYGKGFSTSDLDEPSFIAVANYCDELVSPYDGAPANMIRWQFDGIVNTERSILDNLNDMRMTCRMFLIRVGDKYKLRIDKDDAPVFTLTEKNIIGGWAITDTGIQSRYNRVDVDFINPEHGYQQDFGRHDSTIFRTEDNGRMLLGKFTLPYTTGYYRALNYGELALKQSRQNMMCSVVVSPEALQVEPGDVVAITHAVPGWTAKKWRVLGIDHAADGLCTFDLSEHDSTVYNLDAKIEAPDEPDTNLPDPNTVIAPTALSLASGTLHLLIGTDGTVISRIRAQWVAPPDIFVIGYETEWKKTSEATWRPGPATSSRTSVEVYISPVDDGAAYDVRVRAVNSRSKVSAWLTVTNHTVIGKTEPPPDVQTFLVDRQSDGTRQFTWVYPSPPPDLAGFEIRYKLGLDGVWASMLELPGAEQLQPYVRLFESNQLAAGQYTVAIKAFDTSGNYSVNATYINSTLGDPRIKGQLYIESARKLLWAGEYTNAFVTYEGDLAAIDDGTWASAPAQWSGFLGWYQSPRSPVTYDSSQSIDLEYVFKFTPLISVTLDGVPVITINYSVDNVNWSGWVAPGGVITARYFKYKVVASATAAFPVVVIRDINVLLSAELLEEDLEDVVSANLTGAYRLAVGDVRLPKVRNYTLIKNIEVALQNVGAGWTWELKDKDATVGPRIVIWNGNTKADATFDAHIRGI